MQKLKLTLYRNLHRVFGIIGAVRNKDSRADRAAQEDGGEWNYG